MDLKEFQKTIKDTYYKKDNARGLWPTFGWLVEEVGELARDIRKGNKDKQIHELGDVFAWLVSIANILKIDVSETLRRYANGCPKCGKIPCICQDPHPDK